MKKTKELKRENFDVSPEQQAEIETLQALIQAPSKKDAMLLAVHLALHLASEARKGNQLFVGDPAGHDLKRLVMLGIEKPNISKWLYLVEQAHPWKKQLFVKGRKLPAASVWTTMIANKLNVDEAADNWDLPVEAVHEILEYCENNKALLQMEAHEELRRLEEKGFGVVAKLLVDECILDKILDARLRAAGHDIVTVAQAGLLRKPGHAVFEAAIAANRLVITINCPDFVELAEAKLAKNGSHPGVLLVYRHNVPGKELTYDDIVNAIANLEATGLELKDGCHKLNDYKY